jgi:hypothetical protein
LAWASGWGYLPASAGDGTTGGTIGITMGGSSTTTTHTSRIAGRSSIAIAFVRVERTSIVAAIHVAGVLAGIRRFTGATRTQRQERIPAPSVGSAMAGVREPTHSEDSLALADSTAAEAASMVGAAATAAGAIDSSHDVTKP